MRRKTIERLQSVQGFPALTITFPTYKSIPEAQQNPIRLKNMVKHAEALIKEQSNNGEGSALLRHLHEVVDNVDMGELKEGLAIFVHEDLAEAHVVAYPLPERVVLDDSFVTRDVVRARLQQVNYWVLALSNENSRLFSGVNQALSEVRDFDFPLRFDQNYEVPSTPGAFEDKHASFMDERHRQFYRRVDTALSEALKIEALPVVVLGVQRNLAYFKEVTENEAAVAGTAQGNYDHAHIGDIAAVAWEALEPYRTTQQQNTIEAWERAVGAELVMNGIEAVWQAAFDGRGDLLLVEEGYYVQGSVDKSGRDVTVMETTNNSDRGVGATLTPDPTDARYDLVDDLIELVLSRGGRVQFVEAGTLSDGAGVGLTLRY
jgi:hypothetical protein